MGRQKRDQTKSHLLQHSEDLLKRKMDRASFKCLYGQAKELPKVNTDVKH